MDFGVLNKLSDAGAAYLSNLEAQQAAEKPHKAAGGACAGGGHKRRAGGALSVRDPWKYVGRRECRNRLPWPSS